MSNAQPPQDGSSGQRGFPLRLFAAAFAFSLLAAAFGAGLSWRLQDSLEQLAAKQTNLTEYSSHVMLFDEALTMSARMAAATGDASYKQRYDKLDSDLDALLKETEGVLRGPEVLPYVKQTDAANRKLVEIERRAFTMSSEGKLAEATALLVSDEYMRLKRLYADGVEKTVAQQKGTIEAAQRHLRLLTIALRASTGVIVLVLLLTWYFALRAGRRWSRERLRSEEALRKARDELEARVRERTANLQIANEALEESSERFRAIGESAQDGMIIIDPEGNVVYWNPAAERIFGYAQDEIMGRSMHNLLAPERYRAKAVEGYKRFAATGQGEVVGKTLPLEAIRKDGTEFPVDLSVSALRLGGVWHALGVARDVSERKQAEATLREREAELKEAQRVAHVGNWAWLPESDVVEWSEELYRIFGCDPSLPPPSLQEQAQFMTPESFSQLKAAMAECRDSGAPYEIDLELVRPDGTTAWVSARGERQHGADGHIARIRGTAQDITARKRAEEKALEGEATFRSLVENGISGIAIASVAGTIEYLNPRFANMLGFEVMTDLVDRSILEFVSDADKPVLGKALETLSSGRQSSVEVTMTLLPRRGGAISVLVQGSLTIFKGKRTVIAVALDITERKQAEEKIATLNKQLTANLAALRRHARDTTLIGGLSDILQSCRSTAEAYPIIATTAGNLFHDTNGAFSVVASGTHELDTVAQWGADQNVLPGFPFDDCWALRTGQWHEGNGPGDGAMLPTLQICAARSLRMSTAHRPRRDERAFARGRRAWRGHRRGIASTDAHVRRRRQAVAVKSKASRDLERAGNARPADHLVQSTLPRRNLATRDSSSGAGQDDPFRRDAGYRLFQAFQRCVWTRCRGCGSERTGRISSRRAARWRHCMPIWRRGAALGLTRMRITRGTNTPGADLPEDEGEEVSVSRPGVAGHYGVGWRRRTRRRFGIGRYLNHGGRHGALRRQAQRTGSYRDFLTRIHSVGLDCSRSTPFKRSQEQTWRRRSERGIPCR